MVDRFTKEEVAAFRKTFELFDIDRDGIVTIIEAGLVLREHGICIGQRELEKLAYQVSKKRRPYVDFPQFLAIMSEKYFDEPEDEEQVLRNAFKVFDKEGNGYISCQELHRIMVGLGEQMSSKEADKMILEADTDHDGQISIDEFLDLMTRGEKEEEETGYYRAKSHMNMLTKDNTFLTKSKSTLA